MPIEHIVWRDLGYEDVPTYGILDIDFFYHGDDSRYNMKVTGEYRPGVYPEPDEIYIGDMRHKLEIPHIAGFTIKRVGYIAEDE